MFGDVLKRRLPELKDTIDSKKEIPNAYWVVFRDIIIEELKEYGNWVDSDIAIETYYYILNSNESFIPDFKKKILKSNGQESYRVCNRNMWSSNAWHRTGLESIVAIKSVQEPNYKRKGNKRLYKYKEINI